MRNNQVIACIEINHLSWCHGSGNKDVHCPIVIQNAHTMHSIAAIHSDVPLTIRKGQRHNLIACRNAYSFERRGCCASIASCHLDCKWRVMPRQWVSCILGDGESKAIVGNYLSIVLTERDCSHQL